MAATGKLALSSSGAYLTEQEWRDKTGISTDDESSSQFDTDLKEARFLVRRNCFYLVREEIIFKRSDDQSYLPVRFITDANMDGSVTTDDLHVYQLADDGFSYDAVADSNISNIDEFNNVITFDSSFNPTNQLYITYYAASKPFDEISVDEGAIERALSAQVTLLCIKRLRLQWGLKGTAGWSVPGVQVNKDINAYKELWKEAHRELKKYKSYLRPFIGRKIKMGQGDKHRYDPNVAYSSQLQPFIRIRRGF